MLNGTYPSYIPQETQRNVSILYSPGGSTERIYLIFSRRVNGTYPSYIPQETQRNVSILYSPGGSTERIHLIFPRRRNGTYPSYIPQRLNGTYPSYIPQKAERNVSILYSPGGSTERIHLLFPRRLNGTYPYGEYDAESVRVLSSSNRSIQLLSGMRKHLVIGHLPEFIASVLFLLFFYALIFKIICKLQISKYLSS